MDSLTVLGKLSDGGISIEQLSTELGWSPERCQIVLDSFVQQAICWIDLQSSLPTYWVAGMFI